MRYERGSCHCTAGCGSAVRTVAHASAVEMLRPSRSPGAVFLDVLIILLFFSPLSLAHALDIVVVKSAGIKPYNDALEGFKSACKCTVIEINLSKTEKQDIARRILALSPDAVLAIGTDAFRQVRTIREVPVFYSMVLPSESLDDAPGNISGVSMQIPPELYLGSLLELFPHARRLGIVYDPNSTGSFVREAARVARDKGVELVLREAGAPREVPSLVEGMRDKIDLFWMLPDATVVNSETVNAMLLFSFQHNIPLFSFSDKYVEMGALAALTISPYDLGVQTGEIARAVLSGQAGRGPLRVNARKTVLSVNRKIARKLGIAIREEAVTRGGGRFVP
ncbi:MAG: ABC transporter substrate binding protein [Nitrospirota bacterium]